MKYAIGKFDPKLLITPEPFNSKAQGFTRSPLISHENGSVHMGVAISQLSPNGFIPTHIQINERGIFILEGELQFMIEDSACVGIGGNKHKHNVFFKIKFERLA